MQRFHHCNSFVLQLPRTLKGKTRSGTRAAFVCAAADHTRGQEDGRHASARCVAAARC